MEDYDSYATWFLWGVTVIVFGANAHEQVFRVGEEQLNWIVHWCSLGSGFRPFYGILFWH